MQAKVGGLISTGGDGVREGEGSPETCDRDCAPISLVPVSNNAFLLASAPVQQSAGKCSAAKCWEGQHGVVDLGVTPNGFGLTPQVCALLFLQVPARP